MEMHASRSAFSGAAADLHIINKTGFHSAEENSSERRIFSYFLRVFFFAGFFLMAFFFATTFFTGFDIFLELVFLAFIFPLLFLTAGLLFPLVVFEDFEDFPAALFAFEPLTFKPFEL